MKQIIFVALILVCSTLYAQKVNITSFQHTIRWVDENGFVSYPNKADIEDSIFSITSNELSKRFNCKVVNRPTHIEFRNIMMFGKPKMKEPENSNDPEDFQVSIQSFYTRATTGFLQYWYLKIIVNKNGQNFFVKETKHQIEIFNDTGIVMTKNKFILLYKDLISELLENRESIAEKISLGVKVDYSALLNANNYEWEVDRNSIFLGFGKPSFGNYTTVEAGKTDTATIRSKTKVGSNGYLEFFQGKSYFDHFNIVDFEKTKFCYLVLQNDKDTFNTYFNVNTLSRHEKQSVVGFLLSGSNTNNNGESKGNEIYYTRNVSGYIKPQTSDTTVWEYNLINYVDGQISTGTLKKGSFIFNIYSNIISSGAKKEIVLCDSSRNYVATMVSGLSHTMIKIRKDLNSDQQNAIANLFAVINSIKKLPE